MLFPTHDENDHSGVPVITYLIILVCMLAFLPWFAVDDLTYFKYIYKYGFVSAEIFGEPMRALEEVEKMQRQLLWGTNPDFPRWMTAVTAIFLHGDFWHIAGNLWFLTIFADNVEHAMGKLRFIVFFILSGALAFMVDVPFYGTDYTPAVGASGAISAVMGAYMVYYPQNRIHMIVMLIPPFFTRVAVRAIWMVPFWFSFDFLMVWLNSGPSGGGVDFWAHVGGFVLGAMLAKPFKDPSVVFLERQKISISQRKGQFSGRGKKPGKWR